MQPPRWRYGFTPQPAADFNAQVTDVYTVYRDAPPWGQQGARVGSPDELTGVQALERKPPGRPMASGQGARREFEYIRHGTCTCILSREVVPGQVRAPSAGPPRTEADFLAHVQGVVATDPQAPCWHFVVDNLDIQRSASLVQWVAEGSGLTQDVGVKGTSGIVTSRQSRAAFLGEPSHRVVLHDTPQHGSWLNQIEIGLSIVVRKLLHRGSFVSGDDLKARVFAFIEYYTRTMAQPFKWTSQGKPLTV